MGCSVEIGCSCGFNYSLVNGAGMSESDSYQEYYQEIVKEALEGKYGDALKQACSDTQYFALDVRNKIYCCPCCHEWFADKAMDFYLPRNTDFLLKSQYGSKTVKEWGFVPYVTELSLLLEFCLKNNCLRFCNKCNMIMESYSYNNLNTHSVNSMKCPECGKYMSLIDTIMFD